MWGRQSWRQAAFQAAFFNLLTTTPARTARPGPGKIAENIAERGHAGLEQIEVALPNQQDVRGSARAHCRVAANIGEHCHLPEIISRAEIGNMLKRTIDVAQNFAAALFDHVNVIADVALIEDDLARLEMLAHDAGLAEQFDLHQIRRKHERSSPMPSRPGFCCRCPASSSGKSRATTTTRGIQIPARPGFPRPRKNVRAIRAFPALRNRKLLQARQQAWRGYLARPLQRREWHVARSEALDCRL